MSYYLRITVIPGGKKKFDVANSEEKFRNTTILELRRKIASEYKDCYKFGCRLICPGLCEKLEDHYTLGHYGITQGSTLLCFIPMRGGGCPEGAAEGIPRTESMERLRLSM